MVRFFLHLCEQLGVPVAHEKTEWGDSYMVFLGILLDGEHQLLTVLEEKCLKALNWLNYSLGKNKATVKEMEKLAGLLNFLGRAVYPGRAFTRRMYSKFTALTNNQEMKKYYHVNLDAEFKEDCRIWKIFLTQQERFSISRPFMDLATKISAEKLFFYTDAAGNS